MTPAAPTQNSSILIVDDDPTLLKLLNTRLTLEGYSVTAAASGEEALAKFAAGRPDMVDRKSTRLNSSHIPLSRMPSSA